MTSADSVVRARAEKGHQWDLATVFGTVTVTRIAYRAPGVAQLYPVDAALNLPVGKRSMGCGGWPRSRLRVGHSSRPAIPSRARAGSGRQASARGARRGRGRRCGRLLRPAERPSCPDTDLLILTFDGKGIVMRPKALREATPKAAQAADHKLATRLSPGEKHGRERMTELAGVYDATPAPRAPGDVVSRPGQPGTGKTGPHARGKWLTVSITDDIPAVINTAFDEAQRRDPDHRRPWVALVDGNTTQIEAIQAEATRRQATLLTETLSWGFPP